MTETANQSSIGVIAEYMNGNNINKVSYIIDYTNNIMRLPFHRLPFMVV